MELASIAQRYLARFKLNYGKTLSPDQWSALNAIIGCRTPQYGQISLECGACSWQSTRYQSCGHRSCNQCQNHSTTQWLERQTAKLLPVEYFMVTFTLPEPLRKIARRQQKVIYQLLFQTAAAALQELAQDPRFVGGQIGMVGVLHTWGRDLSYHPHVHFLVPVSSRGNREIFEAALRLHGGDDLSLTMLFGHSHDALAAADLALVTGATASLEAVLFKTPMILAFRRATLTGWLARRMLDVPHVGLPNMLMGARVVPEFHQQHTTPWALSGALMELTRDTQARRRQTECFQDIHLMLRQDSAVKASDAVLGVLDGVAR